MRKTLLGVAAGVTALAISAEARACSRFHPRPSEMEFGRTYEEWWAESRFPRLAPMVRNSLHISVAIAVEVSPIQPARGDHQRRRNNLERQPEFAVEFFVVEHLFGEEIESITVERAGGLPVAPPSEWNESLVRNDVGYVAEIRSLDYHQFPAGALLRDSCGDATDAIFVAGWPYLIFQGASGEISAAIALAGENVTAHDAAALTFDDHVWVEMTRIALENPQRDFVHQITIADFLRSREPLEIIEVADCRYPSLRHVEWLGSIGRYSLETSRPGYPTNMEELLASHFASPRMGIDNYDPPMNESDLAAFDAHRYEEVPFDAESCQEGARFLSYGYLNYHAIDDNDVVDLTELPSQVFVTDPGRYSLTTVRAWLEPEDPNE